MATISIVALLAMGAAATILWLDNTATATRGVRHNALHLNCPPGSHGQPRYATFGKSLGYNAQKPNGSAPPLRDRGLTAPLRSP